MLGDTVGLRLDVPHPDVAGLRASIWTMWNLRVRLAGAGDESQRASLSMIFGSSLCVCVTAIEYLAIAKNKNIYFKE